MDVRGKNVVVTGGASGIGAALVALFEREGARVCVLDLAGKGDQEGHIACDVSDESVLVAAIEVARNRLGSIDIYVSNAGVLSHPSGAAASASNADWARCWSVNVMAHVYAARAVVPEIEARGSGHFVIVASAAGLLNQIGDAAYSATKHAAVSFAESLAITHGAYGLGVTVVCPQYVATPLLGMTDDEAAEHAGLLTAADVADVTLDAIREENFLALPHPQVQGFAIRRAEDHDAWVSGMARLRARAIDQFGDTKPERFYKLV